MTLYQYFFQNLLFDKNEKPNQELGIEEALNLMRDLGIQSPMKGRETLDALESQILSEGFMNEQFFQEDDEEEQLRRAIEMSLSEEQNLEQKEDLIRFD